MINKIYKNVLDKLMPSGLNYDFTLLAEIAISFFFLINIIISSISNYNTTTLLLKTTSVLSLLLTVILARNKLDIDCKNIISSTDSLKVLIILSVLLFMFALSLIHSENKIFGFQKFYLIIVQLVPTVIITHVLETSWNRERTFAFTFNLIVIGITAVFISLLINPFDPFTVYKFSINRWSHVVFGRFIGIPIIISLYLILKATQHRVKIFWSSIFLFLSIGLLLSGFRAGAIGIMIVFLFVLIHQLLKNFRIFVIKDLIYFFNIVSVLILFLIVFKPEVIVKRFSFIKLNNKSEAVEDSGIKSRFESYGIAMEMGKENLFFGVGLGGFNNVESPIANQLHYPHNIFLEFFSETGIIGLTLLIILLIIIFKSVIKINFWILLFYSFFLWLALFSKDIPSNTILFTGIAFLSMQRIKRNKIDSS